MCVQGGNFQAEIQRQMHERQQRAKRKRDTKPTYRYQSMSAVSAALHHGCMLPVGAHAHAWLALASPTISARS